eukprot:COSAG02_NODE_7225_length_3110_cov_4.343408_4_plen_87_part_00
MQCLIGVARAAARAGAAAHRIFGGPLRYDGIMVCVGMFSKRVIAVPVWESSAAEVMAEQFYRAVVCNRGVPLSIVSDRDARFTGAF